MFRTFRNFPKICSIGAYKKQGKLRNSNFVLYGSGIVAIGSIFYLSKQFLLKNNDSQFKAHYTIISIINTVDVERIIFCFPYKFLYILGNQYNVHTASKEDVKPKYNVGSYVPQLPTFSLEEVAKHDNMLVISFRSSLFFFKNTEFIFEGKMDFGLLINKAFTMSPNLLIYIRVLRTFYQLLVVLQNRFGCYMPCMTMPKSMLCWKICEQVRKNENLQSILVWKTLQQRIVSYFNFQVTYRKKMQKVSQRIWQIHTYWTLKDMMLCIRFQKNHLMLKQILKYLLKTILPQSKLHQSTLNRPKTK